MGSEDFAKVTKKVSRSALDGGRGPPSRGRCDHLRDDVAQYQQEYASRYAGPVLSYNQSNMTDAERAKVQQYFMDTYVPAAYRSGGGCGGTSSAEGRRGF